MDYSLIETFVVICEVKNLTRASELLYKTQPTISNRIQQLENMLGYSLLVREKGKQEIQLTERGKAFLPKARQFYEMYTNLFAPGEDVAESLLISSIASFQIPLICDVCKDLGAQLPTRFQIYTYQTEDVYNFISHKKIDLAIASAAHDVQGVVWEPLFQQTYYVAVPCEHPQGIQTISPDDLDVIQELYQPWDDDFYYWHRRVFHGKAPKLGHPTGKQPVCPDAGYTCPNLHTHRPAAHPHVLYADQPLPRPQGRPPHPQIQRGPV